MKKAISILLVLCMVMGFVPAYAAEADTPVATSGVCGDNLTWEFDETTGTLTISGTGEMWDWKKHTEGAHKPAPWGEFGDSIKNLIIKDGVTRIGDCAFDDCSSLTSIIIPDGVTSIGEYAFYSCSSLTSISIPDGVTSIEDYTFYNCDSLTSVRIPDSVTSIEDGTFYGCDSLTSISIPDSVTSIGRAFSYCYSLTSVRIPDGVTSIEDGTFYSCDSLTSISIPDSVTSIGQEAFLGCNSITSISIPDSVTSIGDLAFRNCYNLTSVSIPDGVTSIGDSTFSGCSGLTSISIPDNVTSIGNSAFSGCSGLTSVRIPDNVTSIGNSAFSGCSGLTSVRIPDSVTSIGNSAFRYCRNLASISIPDSVTSIGDGTFRYCENLTSISIPDSVTSIGEYAFSYCDSLTSISIPDGVTSIREYAFYSCSSLTSISIPDSVTLIWDSAFRDCSSLTNIIIPDGVTSIREYAFSYCDSLTSVRIPDSTTSIGEFAFYNCSSLTSIIIPNNVTAIGYRAFDDCDSLETVYYSGTRADWDAIAFTGKEDLTNANIIFAEPMPDDYETGNGTDPEVSNLYVVGRTPDKETVDRASVFECEFNLPVRKPEADEPDSYITVKDGYHVDPIYTLNTKSDLVQVDGSKVYFDLGNAELEEGTLYFIIFDEGSVYALDGTPFYGMKYNLVDNKAWQFQISGADSDVTLKWDTKGHLWWKDDDESKPPYPDGTDEEYAAVIAKWAREAGIENVTEATVAAMLDEPAYMPVTDVNNSTWLLNDGGTTVRQVVEDLIFIENLQPYLEKLDRNLKDRGEAYKMIMDWNDQIQDYLRKRSGKSNMFFSAAMPLAHEALTYLTKGVGGDVYKYTKPILKANIDQSIQNSSMSGLEAYDNYHDYKEAVSEIGEAVSTGKSVYKALAGGGASGWLKLGWDMFSEYYNGAGSDVIDEITSVLSDVVKIKGAMQIAMAVGNTAALFPLVMDFYSRSMKGIKDNVAGMYFVYYYYIFDEYPQIYEMLYDEANDSPSDYYLSDVMANYAGKILDDPILESWVDYMEKTDADKYLQRECTQLRRDLANYALLLLYAKSIDISEAQEGLARYISAELSDAETMRDILIGSCPVRINIYSNSTGELAASLSSEDPDIMDCEYGTLYLMGENNETKCFVLNSGDYWAEILPYDNGTMDVLLTEVGENGEMTSAYYEDVELVEGQKLSLSGLKPDAELENNGQAVQPETAIPVENILLAAPAELAVGENASIGVEIMPATATEQSVSWESSNHDIVEVSGKGVITAKAAGDAEITATVGGVSQSVEISAYLPAESITLDVDSVTMCAGEELPVSASVYPSNATHGVKWSSSAGSVTMVDENGCITALSEGMAVLTAEADGAEAYINVTVYEQPVNVIIYQSDTNGDRIKVDILNGSLYTNFTGSVFVALYDGAGRMVTVTELPAALGAGTHMTSYVPVDGLDSYDGLQAKAFAVNGQMAPVSVSVSMPLIA